MYLRFFSRAGMMASVLMMAVACTTYTQQKADALSGGPERRVQEAKQRQQAAQDANLGLKSDQEALAEEREMQEQQIVDLNRQVRDQEQAIARARAENRISRAKEQQLRDRVRDLDRDIQEAELRRLSASASGNKAQERALESELDQLRSKARSLDREISDLSS
ncbi:hypothetical protein [Minwuia sp.]|uniref:hypothetical protein n=1 Tax=Minwuia sp. TaxID=2493630 RepID=UPI003A91264C